ncbi:hybrid sensor histidine kinase/response regulator [Ideonella sp.]|uniref:hybrid sensor histidine kinase/response regulator n=1 Tax=Ideonella sp. TaxID=1929293 RepID=UPI002B474C9B|nr:ATP-binding protein [Ideonella sp.]HJV71189.1 ATP-binding protein [Ideonella sp.]
MLRLNSSLVTRMIVSVAAFGIAVFLLVGGIELWRERGELTRSAHVRADAALGLSSPPIALALWNYDLATLDLLARNLVRDGAIVRVQVLADDGKALVDVWRPGFDSARAGAPLDLPLKVAARPAAIGTLRVSESFAEIDAQIERRAMQRLPWELLKVVAIALGLLWVMHRLVTRRLLALVHDLRDLKIDDPLARLPAQAGSDGSGDEVIVLSQALNRFLDARASESLRREAAEQQLRAGLQERSAILGSLRDGLLALDGSMAVRYANDAAARLLGQPAHALAGRSTLAGLATVAGPGSAVDFVEWLAPRLRRREARTDRLTLQPGGAPTIEAQAQITPVSGAREVVWIVVISDISDTLRTRAAEQARAAAEAASLAKTEFLSRMSHELRTPLNAIVGFAQSLSQDPVVQGDPKRREGVALIERAGWHLTGMISDVLDLSRIESGRLRLTLGPVDLAPLARDALAFVAADAERDQVMCALDIADDARWVHADPVRVEQVLVNLLSNAVKYNRAGGQVWLRARPGPGGSTVQVTVRDTGLGMTPAQLDGLYQSFNRLGRESSGKPGAGIGLVVTRTLVSLMQGQLSVRSQPGQGSEFTVTLPAAQSPAEPADGEMDVVSDPRAEGRPRRLLYVEDDAVNALVMAALVGRRPDLTLEVCGTLAEGLAHLHARPPDLLLLDMQLPDGRGLELLHAIAADPRLRRLPVVMVSADAMDETVNAAIAAGARAYVTKPLAFDEVLRQIDAVMAGSATTMAGGLDGR